MTAASVPAAPTGSIRPQRAGRRRRIGEQWYTPYLFIAPHFILFLAFVGWPFIFGVFISLHNYNFARAAKPFVGVQNYVNLFNPSSVYFDPFWKTLWNTLIFVITSVPMLVIVALALAALLNGRFRGRNFFRGIYFAPWALSVAVVGLLWVWIFQGADAGGLISTWMEGIGLTPPRWLTSNPPAWITILVATLWWTIGFNTIIFLAGMQAISVDLYEAASIDGASKWQQFWAITIPSLRPILLLVVTLQVIASFNLVGQPQIITGGGPSSETSPVLLYIFNIGFRGRFELGQAAAMAFLVALIMVVVSIINFRVFGSERA